MQELIYSISRKKGKVGYMAIKTDLEKAYDKLELSFIRDMLTRVSFPKTLIEIVMSCVSTVTTSILFNGGFLDDFCPTRGIRQRDPQSSCLFILCMDYLGQLIEEKCEARCWTSAKASRGRPTFSHLFFADNLVLFAKIDQTNCSTV